VAVFDKISKADHSDMLCAGSPLRAFSPLTEKSRRSAQCGDPVVIARFFRGIEGGDISSWRRPAGAGFPAEPCRRILGFTAFAVFSGIYTLIGKVRGRITERKPYPSRLSLSWLSCNLFSFLMGEISMKFLKNRTVRALSALCYPLLILFALTPLFNQSVSRRPPW
jgi:hypothetical protein